MVVVCAPRWSSFTALIPGYVLPVRQLSAESDALRRFGFLWLLYSAFILYGTLIPFNRSTTMAEVRVNVANVRWIPFVDLDGSRASIPDVVQNILLFAPFGFLGVLSLGRPGRSATLTIVILGALLSAGVEILQLFTLDRTTSATDLVTNSIGTTLGSQFALFVFNTLPRVTSASVKRQYARNEYSFFLGAALLLVVLGALQPFDFTLDVGTVGSKVKSLLQSPFAFGGAIRDEGVVFLRFLLLGCVSVYWFRRSARRSPFVLGIASAVLIGMCLEGLQMIVASRMPNIRDVLVATAGAMAGGCLSRISLRSMSPHQWSVLVVAVTLVAAATQLLSPFRLVPEYRFMHMFPFLFYYERTTFVALSNFIESALMFLPMGFLLQLLYPRSNRIAWMVALAVGASALSLELAQGWIDGRYPDITDVLGAMAGGLAGVWVFRERAYFEGLLQGTSLSRQQS